MSGYALKYYRRISGISVDVPRRKLLEYHECRQNWMGLLQIAGLQADSSLERDYGASDVRLGERMGCRPAQLG